MSREDRTISQFCTRLSLVERQEVLVVSRPDRENPGQGGCDAIINRGGRRFALEHTTVDAITGQRTDDARFREVVVPLEESIRAAYPDSWTEITVPAQAVPSGVNWGEIGGALREGCIRAIAQMPFDGRWHQFEFQGVPFPVFISRRKDPQDPACYVMRRIGALICLASQTPRHEAPSTSRGYLAMRSRHAGAGGDWGSSRG